MTLLSQMHRLDKTVNKALSAGVLLGGLGIALVIWFLSYTQARVDAFIENAPATAYVEL